MTIFSSIAQIILQSLFNAQRVMRVNCSMCGFEGTSQLPWRPSILATRPWQRRTNVHVWICDVCISEVRDQADTKLNSFKPTDQTESEKGDKHV
jgi:uncharacterized protein YlaI